jgi:outer membrane protein assembly factor BamD (BamD/ComL family)
MVVLSRSLTACLFAAALLTAASGCQGSSFQIPDSMAFWQKHDAKVDYTTPEDAFVLRGGEMVPDTGLPTLGGDFEGARLLFQQKEYAKAEPIFGKIADNNKNVMQVIEAARYYQAECSFKQGKYVAAGDRYMQLLGNFASAAHGDESRQRLFDIANYWLDETRDQMEKAKEVKEGKRWFTPPLQLVHFEDSKPFLDIEGHALRYLEAVHMTDPRGPLGEKALFYLGSIKFYRQSYVDADNYFFQLVQNYPNSPHAPSAMKLSIICKEICTHGPDYDGRKLQEARDLIETAKRAFPEMARGQEQFLDKQAVQIHNLEAERDFNIACFWERTGHPGSAHFYYVIVTRRYPGTPFADKAAKKIVELEARALREANNGQPGPMPAGGPDMRPPSPGQPLPGPGGEIGPAPRQLPPGLGGAPQ